MGTDAIVIEILKNQITLEGRPVALPPRERNLLFAIAVSTGPLSRARAQAAVWPDLDDDRGSNVLWVTIHRLRKRFPGCDLVRSAGVGYALDPGIRVDLLEAAHLADALRRGDAGQTQRKLALELATAAADADDFIGDLSDYVAGRARAIVERLIEALARDARESIDIHWSLEVAQAQWGLDPSNEEACERVMRGWLSVGDRGSAIGTFRKHSRVLRDELDLEPSAHLLELVRI